MLSSTSVNVSVGGSYWPRTGWRQCIIRAQWGQQGHMHRLRGAEPQNPGPAVKWLYQTARPYGDESCVSSERNSGISLHGSVAFSQKNTNLNTENKKISLRSDMQSSVVLGMVRFTDSYWWSDTNVCDVSALVNSGCIKCNLCVNLYHF